MKTIELTRQNSNNFNFEELSRCRRNLDGMLEEIFHGKLSIGQELVDDIIEFQHLDGSFTLAETDTLESDAFIDYYYAPTYICSAILIKAFMENKELFKEREYNVLPRALKVCSKRDLYGHGYDGLASQIEAIKIFMQCGVKNFIKAYPYFSVEFTRMFSNIAMEYRTRHVKKKYTEAWGESYEPAIIEIAKYFSSVTVFVYGTLKSGKANHDKFMKNALFLGTGYLNGYDMYDLRHFPGIVKGRSGVQGEVYSISIKDLELIDKLEGEGKYYKRILETINIDCFSYKTYVYLYLGGMIKRR